MSYNTVGPHYSYEPPKPPKSHRIRNALLALVLIPAGLLVGVMILALALAPDDTSESDAQPVISSSADQTITPKPKPTPAVPKKAAITDDGVWMVPSEVKPGTYRSTLDNNCYWARLSSTTGDAVEGIITNGMGRNQTVTIKASDKAFETSGCGSWVKVR